MLTTDPGSVLNGVKI